MKLSRKKFYTALEEYQKQLIQAINRGYAKTSIEYYKGKIDGILGLASYLGIISDKEYRELIKSPYHLK